jgi:IS5 family transposase
VTRRVRFLGEIDAVTPWSALVAEVEPFYPKGEGRGRPPIALERMLRMYVAQQCFGLSDEGTEDAIYDSQAVRAFIGIDLNRESAPDATTLLKFRRLLETHGLTQGIFTAINTHLGQKGLLLKEGTVVDATIDPYIAVDKLRTFDGEVELFPGIRTIPIHGHTPGHTAYKVESGGQRLLLWGDVIHVAEAQFSAPDITIDYDVNRKEAIASRKKILADAAAQGYLIGSAHDSFLGLGHVRAEGRGYLWIPLPYSAGNWSKANLDKR